MKDNRRSEVKLWRNRKKLRERKEQRRNSSEKNISKKARKRLRESDQARKGAGRMPGHTVLKKDVPNSEMRR